MLIKKLETIANNELMKKSFNLIKIWELKLNNDLIKFYKKLLIKKLQTW